MFRMLSSAHAPIEEEVRSELATGLKRVMRASRHRAGFLLPVSFALGLCAGLSSRCAAAQELKHSPPQSAPHIHRASLLSQGFLSTAGNQIVDAAGRPQRLACVGYNEPGPDLAADIAGMKKAGFNCLRYPFNEAALPSELQMMDRIVAAAKPLGMKVIFDHHVDDDANLCGGQQENGLWFDVGEGTDNTDSCGVTGHKGTITREKFQVDWVTVARHFAGNATVIAFDLHNESLVMGKNAQPITWGTGGVTDILAMFETVGSAIEAVNPGVLIIAECPINYTGKLLDGRPESAKGIMDCSMARSKPIVLANHASKVVYSIHDYPNIGKDNEGPSIADRNAAWGFLEMENLAPVWIGEMGASLDAPMSENVTVRQQRVWARALVNYLNGNAPGGPVFANSQQPFSTDWWTWGSLAGQDPDGTLDGHRLRPAQQAVYSQLQFAPRTLRRSSKQESASAQ